MRIYNILASGSKGNAVVLNRDILIDCGVPFKTLSPVIRDIKLVLLTHIHGDHFRKSTIKRLAEDRPTLRFGCCEWLVTPLLDCDVPKQNIDVFEPDKLYEYGAFSLSPVSLVHDVPNCGYKVFIGDKSIFYATDTANLNGITAPDFDLYLVEANYEDEEIKERIKAKKEQGEYAYELKAMENHLSKADAENWVYQNATAKSEYIFMHRHSEGGQADESAAD